MRCAYCALEVFQVGSHLVCPVHHDVTQALAAQGAPPADHADLDGLPFPVAYPLAWARDPAVAVGDRINNAIFAAYQAMRVTGLVLLADYLACDAVDPALASAIRGLRLPHWSEWSTLCDRLATSWSATAAPAAGAALPPAFPAVLAGWRAVNRKATPADDPWAPLLAGLPGNRGLALSANDALWRLRNDRAHRLATRTPATAADEDALLARLLPLVERVAATLFPPGALTLYRRVAATAPDRVIRLVGPHLEGAFPPEPLDPALAPLFAASEVVALAGGQGRPVYPLFLPLDAETAAHPLGGGGFVEHAAMVDGVSDQRVVLLGVRDFAPRPDLAAPLRDALRRKHVELGLDRDQAHRRYLAEYAAVTAAHALDEVRGRKYLPECYLPREGVDDAFARALFDDAPARGRAVLVVGEAGSGKSSLLARLVDDLLAAREDLDAGSARRREADRPSGAVHLDRYLDRRGRGDVVLYLQGRAAFAGDAATLARALLVDAIGHRAGIRAGQFESLDDVIARLAAATDDDQPDRRVWLILDALNEAERFTDLVAAVDEALPAVARHPWLRLIVSMRTGAWESLRQRHRDRSLHGDPGFAHAAHLEVFNAPDRPGEAAEPRPWLPLRAFSPEREGRAAYLLRQERLPDRASSVRWTRLRPDVQRLLCSPLHLHLFHETFRADGPLPPAGLDEARLFEAYLARLVAELPGLADTLRDIGRLLYDRRRPDLPADDAEAWLDRWRAKVDPVLRVVKLDPIEELVAASVLMRPTEEGVGANRALAGFVFTHQRLAEQVLLGELRRQMAPTQLPDAERLLTWARHAAGTADEPRFDELAGALALLAAALVEAGQGEPLAALLDLDDDAVRAQVLGAAVLALGPTWGLTEAGAPAPRGILAMLSAAASGPRAARFEEAVWRPRRYLERTGHSLAAGAVARAQLAALRGALTHEPHGADLQRDLSVSLNSLGQLAKNAGRGEEARAFFQESLAVRRDLVKQEPHRADLRIDLSASFNNLGQLAQNAGRGEEARALFQESLDVRRDLVKQEPHRADLQRDLSVSLNNLGQLAQDAGRGEEARALFQEDLDVMRDLVKQEPHRADLQRDLSVSLNNLGQLAQSAGRGDEARAFFQQFLDVMRDLVKQEPHRADLQRDLSVSLNNLGQLAQDAGRGDEARAFFQQALDVRRDLVKQEPHRADLRVDLAISCWNQYHATNEREDEVRWLNEARNILAPMREAGLSLHQLEPLWGLVQQARQRMGLPDA